MMQNRLQIFILLLLNFAVLACTSKHGDNQKTDHPAQSHQEQSQQEQPEQQEHFAQTSQRFSRHIISPPLRSEIHGSHHRIVEQRTLTVDYPFGHSAVIQRNQPIVIRGTDSGNVKFVAVNILRESGEILTATAPVNQNNEWEVLFEAQNFKDEFSLSIEGSEQLVYRNLVFGDLWICSGQSNMVWPVSLTRNGARFAAESTDPNLRFFKAPYYPSFEPARTLEGVWQKADPDSTPGFSSIAYHMGRELRQKNPDIPIGLIQVAVSGSRIEPWLPPDSFSKNFYTSTYIHQFGGMTEPHTARLNMKDYEVQLHEWMKENLKTFLEKTGRDLGYHEPGYDDSFWADFDVSGPIEPTEQYLMDGIFWYRKNFDLSEEMSESGVQLTLGRIDDYDEVYINGTLVASSDFTTPSPWNHYREYIVPESLLKPGNNTIAVRVIDIYSGGGFSGPASAMRLTSSNPLNTESVDLSGIWKFNIDGIIPENRSPQPDRVDFVPNHLVRASAIEYSLLNPLRGIPATGILWYQGESNANTGRHYAGLLEEWIRNWRVFDLTADIPVYVIQITGYGETRQDGVVTWPEIREAQYKVAESVENTWIVNTLDVGDYEEIHPPQKRIIGERLALLAEVKDSLDLPTHQPVLKDIESLNDESWRISFHHVDGSLIHKVLQENNQYIIDQNDEFPIRGFYTATNEGHFFEARAWILGDQINIIPMHEGDAVHFRYNYLEYPQSVICNSLGEPVFPFRTDDFRRALQAEFFFEQSISGANADWP